MGGAYLIYCFIAIFLLDSIDNTTHIELLLTIKMKWRH